MSHNHEPHSHGTHSHESPNLESHNHGSLPYNAHHNEFLQQIVSNESNNHKLEEKQIFLTLKTFSHNTISHNGKPWQQEEPYSQGPLTILNIINLSFTTTPSPFLASVAYLSTYPRS
jgi:hypothetical protein